jgi:hypothetical protein
MKIKKITEVTPRTVYAVQTSTGTFIADGLAHHNCYNCNHTLKGNWDRYYDFMLRKYGQETIDDLMLRRFDETDFNPIMLEELYDYYTKELSKLTDMYGNPYK